MACNLLSPGGSQETSLAERFASPNHRGLQHDRGSLHDAQSGRARVVSDAIAVDCPASAPPGIGAADASSHTILLEGTGSGTRWSTWALPRPTGSPSRRAQVRPWFCLQKLDLMAGQVRAVQLISADQSVHLRPLPQTCRKWAHSGKAGPRDTITTRELRWWTWNLPPAEQRRNSCGVRPPNAQHFFVTLQEARLPPLGVILSYGTPEP